MSKRECAKYKISKCYRYLLRRLVEISETTGDTQITRNLNCLEEFFEDAYEYILVQDLQYVIRLVYSIYQKSSDHEVYIPYLLRLLDMCCFPPLLQKTSDIFTYANDIVEYLSMLGYIFVSTQNKRIHDDLYNGLERLFTIKKVPINCIRHKDLHRLLSKSQLPALVADVMVMADEDLYSDLLVTTFNLLDSDDTCFIFLEHRIMDLIFGRIISEDESKSKQAAFKLSAYFKVTIGIVYRLCNVYAAAPEHVKSRLGNLVRKSTWEKVLVLFKDLVTTKGYKKERNILHNILVHCSLTIPAEHSYALINDIIILLSAPENGIAGTWASSVVFTNDEDDFELKWFMMNIHCFFRNRPMFSGVYQSPYCFLGMLRIITPEIELIWTPGQRIKLIKMTLLSLECILKHVLQHFIDYDAPRRLVRLYTSIVDGKLPTHIMTPCIRCIHRSLIEGAETEIPNLYRSYGLTDVLLTYIKHTLARSPLAMMDQVLLITIFCILYQLNKDYSCSNDKVVHVCIECAKRFLDPSKDDCFLDPKVMIALLDYLWEHLTWSECSRNNFVHDGGVYLLLDVLEKTPVAVKLVTLNILVDLTQEGKTFPFIATWRGRDSISCIKLLLNVFRQSSFDNENVTTDGVIKDTELPLMGKKQFEMTFKHLDMPDGSPACLDLLGSLRPKVYSLLLMIQCSSTEHLLRDHYKVYGAELSKLDKVTIPLVENYLPLKMHELWSELDRQVVRAGKKLLLFDQCVIKFHVERANKLAELIQEAQNRIMQSIEKDEITKEAVFYQNLRDQTLSDALTTLNEMILMGITMDRTFRADSKRRQSEQICSRRCRHVNSNLKFHISIMPDVVCTKPFKQWLSVRSNVVIDPNKPEELRPVSEIPSIETYREQDQVTNSSTATASRLSVSEFLSIGSEERTPN